MLGSHTYTIVELDVHQRISGEVELVTYRFCPSGTQPPVGTPALPILTHHSVQPAHLAVSRGLGVRERVRLRFADFEDDGDVLGGDPAHPVSFWRLFRARIPFLSGRALRIIEGTFEGGVFTAVTTYHYIVRKIEGPQGTGEVQIEAEDLTGTLAQGSAQCPMPSRVELMSDITDASIGALVTFNSDLADWPPSGWLRIGDEAIKYAVSEVPGEYLFLSFVQRGTLGTIAEAHSTGDAIQPITYWDQKRLCDILYDLLVTYAGIPAAQIPFDAWEALDDEHLVFRLTTVIWSPTDVEELVSDLLRIFPLVIWYDPAGPAWGFLPFDQVAISSHSAPVVTDLNGLVADSLSMREDPDAAWTRLFIYHGMLSWDEDASRPQAYSVARLFINVDAEGILQRNRAVVHNMLVRWLLAGDSASVDRIGQMQERQGSRDRRTITMTLPVVDWLRLGAIFVLRSKAFVDANGAIDDMLLLVTSYRHNEGRATAEVECIDLRFDGNYRLWAPDDLPVYDQAPDSIKRKYLYLSSDDDMLGTVNDPAHTWL